MQGTNLEISKIHNAEMIDLIFGLMFDILWLSPYDRRRQEPSFVQFERCARQMVVGLRAVDIQELSESECKDVESAAADLADSVEQLQIAGVIPSAIYLQASEQVRELISALHAMITGDETPNR